jgi:hypothetical protein
LFGVLIAAVAASAPNTSPLDVQMTLSSNTILLGEPLWVDVRVTNRSSVPLSVDIGNTCFGAKPLVVEVPQAERRVDKERRCGVREGGDCLIPVPTNLAPGETFTKRYVFDGDFRITHVGRYTVRLTKPLRYGTLASTPAPTAPGFPDASPSETAIVQNTLTVLPANPEKLLQLERGLAAQAMATVAPRQFPPGADIETLRRIDTEYRNRLTTALVARNAIVDGLAANPASGMEPIFASWLLSRKFADYEAYQAATALYNLNTPVARADLAQAVTASPNPNAYIALTYLGLMGDLSYLPLLERLADDPYAQIRPQAIFALGYLGGESEVVRLESFVHSAISDSDRNDAFMAIGYTGSLDGVPFLLSYLDSTGDAPSASFALRLLTHHRLSAMEDQTFHDAAIAWRAWWAQNKTTARAYRPWECDDQDKLLAP